MACAIGQYHTITISDDGVVYSFGKNNVGQLGLRHNNNVSLPSPICGLPKIMEISCGASFTVCVDYEGGLWSFGDNKYSQLGTGNKSNYNIPQKIEHIPPVRSVSCGLYHTLIITNDSNLWSCVEIMNLDNYVWKIQKTNQNTNKHHFNIFQSMCWCVSFILSK